MENQYVLSWFVAGIYLRIKSEIVVQSDRLLKVSVLLNFICHLKDKNYQYNNEPQNLTWGPLNTPQGVPGVLIFKPWGKTQLIA